MKLTGVISLNHNGILKPSEWASSSDMLFSIACRLVKPIHCDTLFRGAPNPILLSKRIASNFESLRLRWDESKSLKLNFRSGLLAGFSVFKFPDEEDI